MFLQAAPVDHPNIVVILVDDMGYGDIGPFGNEVNRTPRLDQMAAEGLTLTSFYAAPCCSPARAGLMTGSYAQRVGLNDGTSVWVLLPKDPIGLNPDEVTLPEVLKGQGYATGIVGKWHLGDQRVFLPPRHGFDEYYGLPYSNDMQPLFDEFDDPKSLERRKQFNHAPLPLLRNETVLGPVEDQTTLTADYTREAIDFIRRHREQPFFLYLAHSMVHVPLHPGARFAGRSKNGAYGDAVEEIDWSTGAILDELAGLGLDEKTLVLFTSDNGGAAKYGANNAPLKGSKGSVWEGGVRVPCLVRWPGQVPPGTSSDAISGLVDLLPTFAHLAGTEPPTETESGKRLVLDGIDLSPVLKSGAEWKDLAAATAKDTPGTGDEQYPPTSSAPPRPRDAYFHYSRDLLAAVRQGKWKLHLGNGKLYNLAEDIGEETDLAAAHPEMVATLTALAETERASTGDKTTVPPAAPDKEEADPPGSSLSSPKGEVREPGRVESPVRLIEHDGTIVGWEDR